MQNSAHACEEEICHFCELHNQLDKLVENAEHIITISTDRTSSEILSIIDTLTDNEMHKQLLVLYELDDENQFPNHIPEGFQIHLWEILDHLDQDLTRHSVRLAIVSVLIFLIEARFTSRYIHKDFFDLALDSFGEACQSYGSALAYIGVSYGGGEFNSNARRGAREKLRSDPKQAAKQKVKECWIIWKKEPNRYKSKSAFSRDMLSKFDDLESQRVIERWCKEWESEPC